MPDSPTDTSPTPSERRFFERKFSAPTLVGAGSHFEGTLNCPGDLSVAGTIQGNGRSDGTVTLSDTGRWQGELRCANALVAGSIDGQLLVDGKLEIRATARISGHITAQQIAIAEGAVIEAEITVIGDSAIHRFAEKRRS